MASFSFQVDRAYAVRKPIRLHPDVELKGAAAEVADGQVVYRGTIELPGAGGVRFTFDGPNGKGYTTDRAQLEGALEECYDELIKV